MKKIIVLASGTVLAAAGAVAATCPDESRQLADRLAASVLRAWDGIEANPLPMVIALGTFLLTVAYHTSRGKSLRESVEVAATRVAVVQVPAPAAEPETTVVRRARARATRTQLVADQIGLENRIRKLPDEVKRAEKEACYAEQAVADAERALTEAEEALDSRLAANDTAVTKLEALRKELAEGEGELAAIAAELKKLAEVV
jgi:chromosome segregation ATPase